MLRFGGYLLRFISLLIGRRTINIPEIFSGVHGLTGMTVTADQSVTLIHPRVVTTGLELGFASQDMLGEHEKSL